MNVESNMMLAGLDLGTSAIKGVLLDGAMRICQTAEQPMRYRYPQPGWIESDAEDLFEDVCAVLRRLVGSVPQPIRALALSGASGNTLLADARGRPLGPVINWMDQRCVERPPDALHDFRGEEVRAVTGWPCVTTFPLAHLAWMKQYLPETYDRAARVCMNTDWLLFRFSGEWVIDLSTATPFHLADQVRRRWHAPYLERLGIPEAKLPRLIPSGAVTGAITPASAVATGLPRDTRIVSGSFDHPSAARAADVLEPGQLLLSCGTSWVGFFPESNRTRIIDTQLLCDPFRSAEGGPWGAMFSVPYIGDCIDRYVREIIAPGEPDPYAVFNESAAHAKGGLDIDLRQPAQPIRAPRGRISRSVMESAARLLNEQLQRLRAAGIRFAEATLVGGPARSPVWTDIVREITNLRIHAGSPYAGAAGAARLAGAALGVSSNGKEPKS